MAKPSTTRTAVKAFYGFLGASLLVALAQPVADRLAHSTSAAARAGAVAVGVLAMVPLACVVIWLIRLGDEFERQMHLLAIAIAFGGTLALIVTLDWLTRAGFITPIPFVWVEFAMLVIWFIGIVVAKRLLGGAS